MTAQTLTAQTVSPPAPAPSALIALPQDKHPLVRWFAYLLVAGAFFFIEHTWDSQARWQEIVGATSPDQLATGEMFETSSYRQLGAVALGLFGGLVLLFSVRKERAPLGALAGIILFYILWNGASVVWADDPSVTIRRYVMFVLLCLGAYGVQHQLTLRHLMLFTLWCPFIYLLIGVYAEYSSGTFHPFVESSYRFAGTLHPNTQAVNCALFLLAAISLARSEKRFNWFFWSMAAFAAVFLFLTKSRTALAATVIVLAMSWVFLHSRAARFAAVLLGVAAIAGIFLITPFFGAQLGETLKLGRQDLGESSGSLTGRTAVWEQAWEYVQDRPFLGYGYGGFWNEERTMDFIDRQQWPVPHAHNAYLDVMLESGPLGVIAYVLILIVGIRIGFKRWHETNNPGYAFLAVLLLFCALNGTLESIAIQRSLTTMLCMMALCILAIRQPEPPEIA